ncbi:hypothetical protein [Novosphingobium sp. CECT 9465]|uniref:Dyp-type peroxidase n=1 Tax=Novosphingobium sp. CECT 9465 TaxID=2829794 RepID=UPI001E5B167D|nr:hypothetical protein [Novosphingobium sp. CECT 9465]CAH0495473.1 hypothetical protein NVSP9465_00479 [Novosphingobium sp. CECT 9465]
MSERQDFVTIAIPFTDDTEWCTITLADVERAVEALGNPARADVAERLRAAGTIHFVSIHAIGPDEPGRKAHLLIEATVDGTPAEGIVAIAQAIGAELLPILSMTSGIEHQRDVLPLLQRHAHPLTQGPFRLFGALGGLPFNGLPGLSVKAIARNRAIVERARDVIARQRGESTLHGPQTLFCAVARDLADTLGQIGDREPPKLAFSETADAPWLEFERTQSTFSAIVRGLPESWQLLAIGVILPFLLSLAGLCWNGTSPLVALAGALAFTLAFTGSLVALFGWVLRKDETANAPVDRTPSPANLGRMMARENAPGLVQNHMISVTRLRPARVRRLSLALAFSAIALLARIGVMRNGFLSTIGTIHAARWLVLPGTRQLVFCSNYDGSWESYLEDFITKAARGVTGAWSNTEGFPKTRLLFFDGATDGDRMKRFARCSMRPTAFWFSAHPDLSCASMRKHALIVSGLLCKERLEASPSDAEAWLDLFGSIPRPEYGLQYEEIQTVLFGGLRRHPRSMVVGLRFGPPQTGTAHPYSHVQRWLADLMSSDVVCFGDKPPEHFVCNLAFSAQGLRLLGLHDELDLAGPGTAQGFSPAFALGMAHPSRKRLLEDPAALEWTEDDAHIALLLYAKDDDTADTRFQQTIDTALAAGLTDPVTIRTGLDRFDLDAFKAAWDRGDEAISAPADAKAVIPARATADGELTGEPFGFVDGVSQPTVRGFPGRKGAPDPVHAVEPGEFILGYADNRGFYPPSPLIERPMDALGMRPDLILPAPPPDQPQLYPDFSRQSAMARDFGRNGSYLVIRQLGQDVDGFRAQLDEQAKFVCRQPDVINPHNGNLHRTREWLAAKMLGRWRDGSSLVDHPFHPAFRNGSTAVARNDFLYRDADPQGLRCPFGSHVRRSFPRDSLAQTDPLELSVSNRHRLLRRGRPYLSDDGTVARGTLFMCFNADLERQFEFVQQTWVGSPVFHGLEREADPFAMHHADIAPDKQRFTIPGRNASLELSPVTRHVTLRGGGYFFMPGRHALWFLAGSAFAGSDAKLALPTAC